MTVLAFETSCDETCAAVVRGGKILSNVISSQIDIHRLYGGVVPEIASRNHAMAILGVCREALDIAKVTLNDITHVASVVEPGLRGAVMIGRVFGEGLAVSLGIPFIPINHLTAHIASVAIDNDVKTPFMTLLVSGGHTSLYLVDSWNNIKLLSQTMDDAVGECFDKVAKILGLEYPGGVKIEQLAKEYNDDMITFVNNPTRKDGSSYSGLKTAVLNYVKANPDADKAAVAKSFQHEAVMQLVNRSIESMKQNGIKTITVCGGVSANGYLRESMANAVKQIDGAVIFPQMQYCTDNASMVGMTATLMNIH